MEKNQEKDLQRIGVMKELIPEASKAETGI